MELNATPRPSSPHPPLDVRTKTSQRLKYDAEIKVFEARFGNLENVRQKLGFSRRQMCQLLLVDPSAWTRWHSGGTKPPPHIYRALEWFLILEGRADLHPKVADLYIKGKSGPEDAALVRDVAQLHQQLRRLKLYVWVGPLLTAGTVALGFLLFR